MRQFLIIMIMGLVGFACTKKEQKNEEQPLHKQPVIESQSDDSKVETQNSLKSTGAKSLPNKLGGSTPNVSLINKAPHNDPIYASVGLTAQYEFKSLQQSTTDYAFNEIKKAYQGIEKSLFHKEPAACETLNYPTYDYLHKRRKELINFNSKAQKFEKFLCNKDIFKTEILRKLVSSDPTHPAVQKIAELCFTFNLLISKKVPTEILSKQMREDPKVWKNIVEADFLFESYQDMYSHYWWWLWGHLYKANQIEQAYHENRDIQTIFIGDSLIYFFESYGFAKYFDKTLFMGLPGERTDSLLFRLSHHKHFLNPSNIVISISGNDINQNCRSEDIQARRLQIASELKNNWRDSNIYWMSLPPTTRPELNKKVLLHNPMIESIPQINFMDYYNTDLNLGLGFVNPDYSMDFSVHINELGYKKFWMPLFKQAGLTNNVPF